MQGLWKNKVNGWKKDSRRKKQNYNDFIKDKGRVVLKIYDENGRKSSRKQNDEIYRVENPMVKIIAPLPNKNYIKETNAYKVSVSFISSFKDEEYVIKHSIDGEIVEKTYIRKTPVTTYKEYVCYFDENKDSSFRNPIELKSKKPLKKLIMNISLYWGRFDIVHKKKLNIIVPLPWEKDKEWDDSYHESDEFFYNQKEFFYGKILPDWKRGTFYNDGKRRKHGQKLVNGILRASVRNWITKEDWGAEIKTHAYSKSISWLIH